MYGSCYNQAKWVHSLVNTNLINTARKSSQACYMEQGELAGVFPGQYFAEQS